MSQVIRVIAVVVDTDNLTMYKEDATPIVVAQGDPRIRALVEKAVPAIEAHGFVDIDTADLAVKSHYADVEEKTGGVVRFFRGLKKKVAEIIHSFADEVPLQSMQVGEIPQPKASVQTTEAPSDKEMIARQESGPLTKSQAAVAEIMAHAHGVDQSGFHTPDPSQETTVVAVLADGTLIPGMEQLHKQLQAMSDGVNSSEGVTNFLNRMAKVQRGHSAQDLLKFMEKGELPITNDGCALVYKRINSTDIPGVFVDCHTRTIRQSLGSLVFMSEKLVDHNRSIDCSNGLHVARRDYLHSFSGDVMVLCKLAPEDVIAVPHGDARKLRSRAYHIIAVLSNADARLAINNQPIKDTQLLGNAIAGNHIGITNMVEILDQNRTDSSVKYTNVDAAEYVQEESGRQATSLDELVEDEAMLPTTVDARELALKPKVENPPHLPVVEKALAEAKPVKLSVLQTLVRDWENASSDEEHKSAAEALLRHKANVKKSWTALGIGASTVETIKQAVVWEPVVVAKPVPAVKKAAPKAKVKVTTKANGTTVVKAKAAKGQDLRDVLNVEVQAPAKGTVDLKAMYAGVLVGNKAEAAALLAVKKAKKKGWTALGLPADAGDVIAKLLK